MLLIVFKTHTDIQSTQSSQTKNQTKMNVHMRPYTTSVHLVSNFCSFLGTHANTHAQYIRFLHTHNNNITVKEDTERIRQQ